MKRVLAACAALVLATSTAARAEEVDLELVLLVDVSRSMTMGELENQRQGYASALRSDEVYAAVQAGLLQRIALTYVEWAGGQNVIVDWTVLEGREDLDAFARAVEMTSTIGMRRTSISGALAFGAEMIEANAYEGLRRVIDISGDGPNNQGRIVTDARDDVLARRIVINGLPLMTQEGMGGRWHLDDLDVYYESCVTGGPGSFVIPVLDWTDFGEAVRRKLVLEIASGSGGVGLEGIQDVQFAPAKPPYDCEIGEKIWEQRRMDWWEP